MAVSNEHTEAMAGHTGAIKGHHDQLGGALTKLEQALTAAWDAFYELQSSHGAMGASVEEAHGHAATMHAAHGAN